MSDKMIVGLLWYDDDPDLSLAEKIGQAARHHEQKYGTSPSVCYVHPSALSADGKVKTVGQVRVSARRTVSPNYFWIGIEGKPKRKRRTLTRGASI